MSGEREVVQRYFHALCVEAKAHGIPLDVLGRMLMDEIINAWRAHRSAGDIASELEFLRDNLDPDADHIFMRP